MAARKQALARPIKLTVPSIEPVAETRRKEAEALAAELSAEPLVISDDAGAEAVGEVIQELGAHKAELTRMAKALTDPINEALKQARALFQPAIKAIEVPERALRDALGAYRVRQFEAAESVREAATQAAESGDVEALHTALAIVAPTTADAATTTVFRWAVDRIDEAAMTRDWLTADVAKLNALCRMTSGQEEIEPVPGVTFKREAIVRRK